MGNLVENNQNFDEVFRTTYIIVVIQFLFIVALLVFGWFFCGITDNSVSDKAVSLLWGTIVFLVVISFILRRVLFSLKYLYKSAEGKSLLINLQKNTIFLGLIAVMIGIIGFLVATLSGNKFVILQVGIVALVVFIFNFPQKAFWLQIVDQFDK